jgi:hypothetical protein
MEHNRADKDSLYDHLRPANDRETANETESTCGPDSSTFKLETLQDLGEQIPRCSGPALGDRTRDARRQFDLLQSHRLSHVAETGQLTPRIRIQANHNVDWLASRPKSEDIAYFHGKSVLDHPTSAVPATPTYPRRKSESNDRHEHEQTYFRGKEKENTPSRPIITRRAGGTSQRSPLRPPLQDLTNLTGTSTQSSNSHFSSTQTTTSQQSTEITLPTLTVGPSQNSFANVSMKTHVLRKVNSGFEILKPGTFETRVRPPLSVPNKNHGSLARRNSDQRNRLQKRRRLSMESTRLLSVTSK